MATSGKVEQLENSVWPKHVIKYYIDIMVEEVMKGNMNNGVFTPKVWKNILEKLNVKCQRSYNLGQIKQKFNRLRMKHREFSQLLQHTGFGWNAETNTVTAEEEVWKNYLMIHPEAVQFRKHGLEHYQLLGIIFNRSTATGVLHHASTQDPPNSDDEVQLENEYLNSGIHVNFDKDDDVAPDIVERVTHNGKRSINSLIERERKSLGLCKWGKQFKHGLMHLRQGQKLNLLRLRGGGQRAKQVLEPHLIVVLLLIVLPFLMKWISLMIFMSKQ